MRGRGDTYLFIFLSLMRKAEHAMFLASIACWQLEQ